MKVKYEIAYRYIKPNDCHRSLYDLPIQRMRLMIESPCSQQKVKDALFDLYGLNPMYVRYVEYNIFQK